MNSRERVMTALNHKEPDRVPKYLFYTPEVYKKICKILDINPAGDPARFDIELGNDLLMTYKGISNIPGVLQSEVKAEKDTVFYDSWGIGYRRVDYGKGEGSGTYTEMVYHPLANMDNYSKYIFPDPKVTENYDDHRSLVDGYGKEYAVIAAAPATIFEAAWYLRGFNNFMMDLYANQDFAVELMKKTSGYHLEVAKEMIKIGADIMWFGDDIGMQEGMLISPEQYRKLLKPIYADLISEVKKFNKNIFIAYHTDGYAEPVIPDLIEIGIDILEAVQPACMNPGELKKKYGKNLSFWGGVDVQHIMPFGTAEEVVKEVKERILTIGPQGGYIFCTAHCVQPSERAVGNIFTYYWAAEKYGSYPLKY